MNEEDIGKLFTQTGRDVWKAIGYNEGPTITLENLETKERLHIGANSFLANDFNRLVIEAK